MPARDTPARQGQQPETGTAVFRGRVLAVDGTPLRRAHVRAFSQDGRGGGMASTDAQGGFEIRELPAGRFVITAGKAGYVTMQHGQRRADQPGGGTILDVLDGQVVERIQFVLPRGGVITGRVFDEFGEPIAGAQVTAQRNRFLGGARRMMPAGSDTTDDQGSFRIYGLAPGDYYIVGNVRSQMMSMGPSAASVDVEGFAPSYYPGTPDVAEAQRLVAKGGQELSGINFALISARLARVRGRVTTSAGGPPPAPMMVMATARDISLTMTTSMGTGRTRSDGTFEITGLAPGTYNITARPMGVPNAQQEVGQGQITVANENIDNVLLVLSHGAIVRGFISTDEGTALQTTPAAVRVMVVSTDPNLRTGGPSMPTVNEDWSFEIRGLFDRGLFRAALAEPGDWFLKAIYHRGVDVTDTAFEFTPGQVLDGFQVVFTRKASEITGLVRDEDGQAALDSLIVVFPADSSKWGFQSRYVRTARVDQQGRFRLRNLPPHDDYRIVAVRELEDGRWSDPEFLESVREMAARVTLNEGQSAAQDLRVQRVP